MRRLMPSVLYTDVDGQCDKLVTDDRHQFISAQRPVVTSSSLVPDCPINRAFCVSGPAVWNSLLLDIRTDPHCLL